MPVADRRPTYSQEILTVNHLMVALYDYPGDTPIQLSDEDGKPWTFVIDRRVGPRLIILYNNPVKAERGRMKD